MGVIGSWMDSRRKRLETEEAGRRLEGDRRRLEEERSLERSGVLSRYRRLVVICGMARTGTSALASYVGSHPDIKPVVGGGLWHRLESDYLRRAPDWDFVNSVLDEFFPKKVLFKQPWLENNEEFFDRAAEAKVIVCTRERETLFNSWMSTENVGSDCKTRPMEPYLQGMIQFLRRTSKGAMEVRKECMSPNLAASLGRFLEVDPRGFDSERMVKRWRGPEEKAWLEARAIWRDKR